MNNKIKAVFFDVDATIYDHAVHDIPPSTRLALHRLHKNGYKVGIATSRCFYEMKNTPTFLRTFPFDAMIYDGGALVMEQGKIVHTKFIEPTCVEAVIAYAKEQGLTLRYSTTTEDYFAIEPNQADKDVFFMLYLNTPSYKTYEGEDVLNILVYTRNEEQKKHIYALANKASIVDHHGLVLEINGDTDKSQGIEYITSSWGIQMDEVMCFGDGANDVHMLSRSGIGIAPGNACEEAKAAADFISEPMNEDGIFIALGKYDLL